MKITILVIGLALAGIVGIQSFLILVAPFGPATLAGPASTGIMLALLLIIGAAFAMSLLKASAGCFLVAGIIGFAIGRSSDYHDLAVWGAVSIGLAILAYFADRSGKPLNPFEFSSYQQPPAGFDPVVETPITDRVATATVPSAAVRPVAAPSAADTSVVDQLERLAALRASGNLSDEEFAELKTNLLKRQAGEALS